MDSDGASGHTMIQISHKAKATLETDPDRGYDFYGLAATIATFLVQAEAQILALDLGLAGESIEYRTDRGDVRVSRADDGTLVVVCDTLRRGDRETGRQICFQLTRRLLTRCPIIAVHWHPTQQRLAADRFTWGRLMDMPQRFAQPAIQFVPVPHPGPIA